MIETMIGHRVRVVYTTGADDLRGYLTATDAQGVYINRMMVRAEDISQLPPRDEEIVFVSWQVIEEMFLSRENYYKPIS